MKNEIPDQIPVLLTLAGDAADGAGLHEAGIPLLQNTQANISADITPLVDAIMAYGTGKNLLATRRATVETVLEDSRLFLTLSRDNFKPTLGYEYNQNWDLTGLIGSLKVPRTDAETLPVLSSFKEFLAANPTMEVAAKNITATRADQLFTQLKAARSAVNAQESVVAALLTDRDLKAKKLRKRIRGLIEELNQTIDELDDRWLAFGLNKPGAQQTPDLVTDVVAMLIGPTAVALKWDTTARAEYYHVFKRVQGVDEDYVLVGSPADLDFTIENLPSGKQIDIVVSAVNNGGEGQRSEAVTILTN